MSKRKLALLTAADAGAPHPPAPPSLTAKFAETFRRAARSVADPNFNYAALHPQLDGKLVATTRHLSETKSLAAKLAIPNACSIPSAAPFFELTANEAYLDDDRGSLSLRPGVAPFLEQLLTHGDAPGRAPLHQRVFHDLELLLGPAPTRNEVLEQLGFRPRGGPGHDIKAFVMTGMTADLAYIQNAHISINEVLACELEFYAMIAPQLRGSNLEMAAHVFNVADASRELRAADPTAETIIIPRVGMTAPTSATVLQRIHEAGDMDAAGVWTATVDSKGVPHCNVFNMWSRRKAVTNFVPLWVAVSPPGDAVGFKAELHIARSICASHVLAVSANVSRAGPCTLGHTWRTGKAGVVDDCVIAAQEALASVGGIDAAAAISARAALVRIPHPVVRASISAHLRILDAREALNQGSVDYARFNGDALRECWRSDGGAGAAQPQLATLSLLAALHLYADGELSRKPADIIHEGLADAPTAGGAGMGAGEGVHAGTVFTMFGDVMRKMVREMYGGTIAETSAIVAWWQTTPTQEEAVRSYEQINSIKRAAYWRQGGGGDAGAGAGPPPDIHFAPGFGSQVSSGTLGLAWYLPHNMDNDNIVDLNGSLNPCVAFEYGSSCASSSPPPKAVLTRELLKPGADLRRVRAAIDAGYRRESVHFLNDGKVPSTCGEGPSAALAVVNTAATTKWLLNDDVLNATRNIVTRGADAAAFVLALFKDGSIIDGARIHARNVTADFAPVFNHASGGARMAVHMVRLLVGVERLGMPKRVVLISMGLSHMSWLVWQLFSNAPALRMQPHVYFETFRLPELFELAIMPNAAVSRRGTNARTWEWELAVTASGNGKLQELFKWWSSARAAADAKRVAALFAQTPAAKQDAAIELAHAEHATLLAALPKRGKRAPSLSTLMSRTLPTGDAGAGSTGGGLWTRDDLVSAQDSAGIRASHGGGGGGGAAATHYYQDNDDVSSGDSGGDDEDDDEEYDSGGDDEADDEEYDSGGDDDVSSGDSLGDDEDDDDEYSLPAPARCQIASLPNIPASTSLSSKSFGGLRDYAEDRRSSIASRALQPSVRAAHITGRKRKGGARAGADAKRVAALFALTPAAEQHAAIESANAQHAAALAALPPCDARAGSTKASHALHPSVRAAHITGRKRKGGALTGADRKRFAALFALTPAAKQDAAIESAHAEHAAALAALPPGGDARARLKKASHALHPSVRAAHITGLLRKGGACRPHVAAEKRTGAGVQLEISGD